MNLAKSIFAFFLLASSFLVTVNPLPKPRDIVWSNCGIQRVNFPLNLVVSEPSAYIEEQFDRMCTVLDELKWYPKVTDPVTTDGNSGEYLRVFGCNIDIKTLYIDITADAPLQFGVDESYTLSVLENITITANTTWGALHGLTTLQQLIIYDSEKGFYIEDAVVIHDSPLYLHRGILVDSSRNFLTIDVLKQQIDLMSLTKLNVLHWHLSDTLAWPLELTSYPEMATDAYSSDKRYSLDDVRSLNEYAKSRGVRVVPEIDIPGHSNAGWTQIDEDLVCCRNGWWNDGIAVEPPPGQLDLAYDKTYEVLEILFDELNDIFPDNYVHIGHDELQPACYDTSRYIDEWYSQNPSRNFTDLVQYWIDRSYPILTKLGKLIMWLDFVASYGVKVPKDVLMQVWRSSKDVKRMISLGYDLIVSPADQYYLDCGFGSFLTNSPNEAGSWCDPYKTAWSMYAYDITTNLSSSEAKHIKGAEVAIWGETTDSYNLIQRVWSRTGGFAESVWSGNVNETGDLRLFEFTQRMFNFREYLIALGVQVDPLAPQYCWLNPHSCDLISSR